MKYLTGKDYHYLCDRCRAAIDLCLELAREAPDTDDIEAPLIFATDHGMLCGGRDCTGNLEPGQVCDWIFADDPVILEYFDERAGYWVAIAADGQEVYPSREDLTSTKRYR